MNDHPTPNLQCATSGSRGWCLAGVGSCRSPGSGGAGFTLLELLLVISIVAALAVMAIPMTADALDEVRTALAGRYLQSRIAGARMQAVRRSARVGIRFEAQGNDYRFAEYLDANANGVRSAEIAAGVDPELVSHQLLGDRFRDVIFGLQAAIPDINGVRSLSRSDGVRIGSSRILTVGPDGTATSGTLYLHGRRSQYAVRVLGATGRTRLLRFDSGTQQWNTR